MFKGKRYSGRVSPLQCQTNLVKHIAFTFSGTITAQNKRINHLFKEGVQYLTVTEKDRKSSDFISIDQARKQILLQTGRTVSHSTAARWVAQNNLGHKLSGRKGQWVVDGMLFEDFLQDFKI